MKRMFILFAVISFVFLTTIACDDDKNVTTIELGELPASAREFVSANFSGAEISTIEKFGTTQDNGVAYEVNFKNGAEIEFDQSGEWLSVEASNSNALPTNFISSNLVNYVTDHYADQGVNHIEKTREGFEVELTNDVDLVFSSDGNFIRVNP